MRGFWYWLWTLSERADWGGWRPRWFWQRLLICMDRKHGHYLDYDDEQEGA